MEEVRNIILKRPKNRSIVLDTFYSKEFKNQPIVIFCHGYKGFKDWGAWNLMCQYLANLGMGVVKFNFSHNGGTTENPIDFPDLEAFGQNNYSKELNDLNDILDWTQNHFRNNSFVNPSNINLIGHSRGGGIVILKTAEDVRIKKVITLAGVSDFETRFGNPEEIELWEKSGVKHVINGRTKQEMPHYYQFYEDYLANKERLNIKNATKNISIPHLIIHGNNDTSVKIDEAIALHQWNPKSKLEIIKGADHVFNTKHPWDKDELSEELNLVVENIIDFIK
ncbi:prolyl oligopeptidase family serine peptidase [Winogradskyella sp. DF17]|uniref:Prolyl oligopeptidase family serine peptidase n=1 Tax=Winogradskyella pelagia TaxID=2819984 RepID=A0ABS3T099_9FLAO|nr:prolyl oligopeptidase family serine peptidase [Winogradskyella sp. DF17]MBO3115331.1 prolyl oligopeptidase family serine peptidase [Winogradskyella sp. DF17]